MRRGYYDTAPNPYPEDLVYKAPFFDGVSRIIFAGNNQEKIDKISQWARPYLGCWGENILDLVPHEHTTKEPMWNNAGLVSRHKVLSQVRSLERHFGGETCIIASDVVVFINGEPYHNLSREFKLQGNDLENEIEHLQESFSIESDVRWDITMTFSRKNMLATVGNTNIVNFRPLPPDEVKKSFEDDIPGALGRNTRIPLIDKFYSYVNYAGAIPFSRVSSSDGMFYDRESWIYDVAWQENPDRTYLEGLITEVKGGIPLRGRLDDILEMKSPVCGYRDVWL